MGGNGGRPYANELLRAADLVFYVGCKTDSVTTMNWSLPAPVGGPTVIQLDADPAEIGNSYRVALGLVGDAKLTLRDLNAALDPQRAEGARRARQGYADEIAATTSTLVGGFRAAGGSSTEMPVKALRIIQALQETLPADYVLVADPGTMTPVTAAYFRATAGRRIVIPRAFGGLGYALPGVVGAKLARPEATVVGLMGDGSLGMCAGELETIHRLGLPVVLIQFNNSCFGWIKTLQHYCSTTRTITRWTFAATPTPCAWPRALACARCASSAPRSWARRCVRPSPAGSRPLLTCPPRRNTWMCRPSPNGKRWPRDRRKAGRFPASYSFCPFCCLPAARGAIIPAVVWAGRKGGGLKKGHL